MQKSLMSTYPTTISFITGTLSGTVSFILNHYLISLWLPPLMLYVQISHLDLTQNKHVTMFFLLLLFTPKLNRFPKVIYGEKDISHCFVLLSFSNST